VSQYHVIVWRAGPTEPAVVKCDTEQDLVDYLASLAKIATRPEYRSSRVYIYRGEQVLLTGDPRTVVFPDGQRVVVGEPDPTLDDGTSLLPPARRPN